MISRIAIMLFAMLLLVGCGGKEASTAEAANDPAVTAMLSDLTQAVRRFSAEKQKLPQSLNEVLQAGYIKELPKPPAGQTFDINPKRLEVILVSQ